MDLAKCLSFFFLFHLSFLNSVDSICPNSFHCGNLGSLEFPLSDSSQPECGLFAVNCSNSTNPRIQLGDGGTWYHIIQKISSNKYRIQDPLLQNDLNILCLSLRNLSLPSSPSSSLTFSPNLTLFICDNSRYDKEKTMESLQNYKNYTDCEGFTVYYRQPTDDFHTGESSIFQGCSVVHMAIKSNQDSGELSNLLTAEFTLEWKVSDDCVSCHRREGQCLANSLNEFQCKEGNRNSRKTLLTGVVVVSVISLVTTFIISIVCIRRRKHKLLQFRQANVKNESYIELFLKNNGNLGPRRYKYSELKKITKLFNEHLGKGGYGNVYKGKLQDGRLVAVKILNESKGNSEEFMNEVASISRTSHVNIVTLVGFCFEGSKRALIYEFMSNGL